MKTILVTGGAGFIGSNFIEYILKKYSSYSIINLDKLTYAANLDNLNDIHKKVSYSFFQGDVCDNEIIKRIISACKITDIVHFAAESHVDNSIRSCDSFAKSNILGTMTILDIMKKMNFKGKFIQISTDEVFGSLNLNENSYFNENSHYNPKNPYSATKASADMLVKSYHATYKLNTNIVNGSNNYGPNQHTEKFIPTIIKHALNNSSIPIYGNGENIRDWMYTKDFCYAIDLVLHNSSPGEQYVVGTNTEIRNIDLVNQICDILDELMPKEDNTSYKEQISFVDDRLGHDLRYAIDSDKIRYSLGWEPQISFDEGIRETVIHYLGLWEQGKLHAR